MIPAPQDAEGRELYDMHWRRAQIGTDKDMLERFHESEHAKRVRAVSATPKNPGGIVVGIKMLRKWRCKCVQRRRETECDDTITTLLEVNQSKTLASCAPGLALGCATRWLALPLPHP